MIVKLVESGNLCTENDEKRNKTIREWNGRVVQKYTYKTSIIIFQSYHEKYLEIDIKWFILWIILP